MIDSHAHVTFSHFDEDRDDIIKRAEQAGVQGWVEVGTDMGSSKKVIELARLRQGFGGQPLRIWATVGVHPSDAEDLNEADWDELGKLVKEKEVVAVGEVGIDLYRGGSLAKQLKALQRFIELAISNDLPVVFHVRNPVKSRQGRDRGASAHNEVIKLLFSYSQSQRPKGVIHSFSGSWQQAEEYLDLGMYLAFNGVVTFKNAGETAEVARRVPLERMLLETDCPFLAPEPHRGKRNEPAYVKLVAEKIAVLKGAVLSKVVEETSNNTEKLFGLK